MSTWHILGTGAIGGLFALRLHDLGEGLQLIRRDAECSTLGLTFQYCVADTPDKPLRNLVLPQQRASAEGSINQLLVATKAFDVDTAVASVASRLTDHATIVLLGNGMGYHQRIQNAYPNCTLYAATTTAGCYCESTLHRIIVSDGHTDIGRFDGQDEMPEWFSQWQSAPWSCSWRGDISHRLLTKLAINCVINPPTAIHDVPNGALLAPPFLAEFEQAIKETAQRLRWAGFADIAQQLPQLATDVVTSTRHNTSSMRADKRAGKTTEIEAIIGYLLNELTGIGPAPEAPLLASWLNQLQPAD